jgi:hypothetical protein
MEWKATREEYGVPTPERWLSSDKGTFLYMEASTIEFIRPVSCILFAINCGLLWAVSIQKHLWRRFIRSQSIYGHEG